jgi:hypothetical protein
LNNKYANPFWLSLTGSFMFLFYSFCIIEGPETIEDFAQMQSQEIEDNIMSRRNKIFLLMEEVFSFAHCVFHLSSSSYLFVALLRHHGEVFCMENLIRLDACECSSVSELLKAKMPTLKEMKCLRFHQLFHLCLMR